MNKQEIAKEYHHSGYNCAQSVACTFCEEMGFDKETVFRLSEAFGGGMGTGSTCGAVSAMAMVLSMKNSDGNLNEPKSKKISYKEMGAATRKFLEKRGTTVCKELKANNGWSVPTDCDACIADCVEILEQMLAEK